MNTIELKCELQEIARIISVYEMRVPNYENSCKYQGLIKRQSELFDMLAITNTFESKKTTQFIQGMSL